VTSPLTQFFWLVKVRLTKVAASRLVRTGERIEASLADKQWTFSKNGQESGFGSLCTRLGDREKRRRGKIMSATTGVDGGHPAARAKGETAHHDGEEWVWLTGGWRIGFGVALQAKSREPEGI
jgi:hypothetical protein